MPPVPIRTIGRPCQPARSPAGPTPGSTRRPGPPRRRGSAEARRAGAGRGGSRVQATAGGSAASAAGTQEWARDPAAPPRLRSLSAEARGRSGCVDRRGRAGPAGRTAGGAALPRVLAHRPVAGRRGGLPRGRRLLLTGRPVYSAMTEPPQLLRHVPAVRGGARPAVGAAALRCRRLAVDRPPDRGHRRDRLVCRVAPHPPHRRRGRRSPWPSSPPRCSGCTWSPTASGSGRSTRSWCSPA